MKNQLDNLTGLLVIALVAAAPVLSQAQETDGSSASAQNLRESEAFSLLDEEIDSLSMAEMKRRAQEKLEQIQKRLKQTQRQLERSRSRDRDVAKLNCINENMATMKGFVKISQNSQQQLQTAVAENDRSAAKHYYKLVAVAERKTSNLRNETELCTGQADQYSGETKVEVDVSERVKQHRLVSDFDTQGDNLEEDETETDDGHPSGRPLPELSPYQ